MIKNSRLRIKKKIRKRIHGSGSIPRITVYRSLRSLYAQAIDDNESKTLCSASLKGKKDREAAGELAEILSQKLKEKKITGAVFDRNGYKFGEVLKSFVEGIRKNSIQI